MGRKTWESIPARFRPLKDRLNIVLSKSVADLTTSASAGTLDLSSPVWVRSLEQALEYLQSGVKEIHVGRIFVIGGAQVYAAALVMPETRRVLLTRVFSNFDCDTFFPISLPTDDGCAEPTWARRTNEQLNIWTGEDVPEGLQEENGTTYEFQMWERES